jgi:hypothetical protein
MAKTVTEAEAKSMWASAMKYKAERAERLPDEGACVRAIHDGFTRLKELGWREATYAPCDGTPLHVIEAGSTGIHNATRDSERRFWIEADGDLWPSSPILFRVVPVADASTGEDNG